MTTTAPQQVVPTGSLTPLERSDEASNEATIEGLINGTGTLAVSLAAMYLAMRNPAFMKRTNVMSRTAMVIMPPLFVFGFTSEVRHQNKMREIASETYHAHATVHWAEEQRLSSKVVDSESDKYLTQLYKQSVAESGVCIVPGDQLQPYHVAANWIAANPMKLLAGVAVPSVAWIFWGRSGKEHLDFSVKLLHTRVFGQFATISLLLTVMGFKEYMDKNGNFITEKEAEERVEAMKRTRLSLLARLEAEEEHRRQEELEIKNAHDADVKEGHVHTYKPRKKNQK